jgi:phosphoribosyl 1,2-cyclic phosphate phosphodiesterase
MQMHLMGTGAGDFLAPEDEENQAGFLPEVGRLGGRNRRYASCAALLPDILIDFYGDRQIRRSGLETGAIRHLLITHGHWDHFQPLAIIDFARELDHPLQVYGNDMVTAALQFAATHQWQETAKKFGPASSPANISTHAVHVGRSFEVGEATITAVQADHCVNKKIMVLEQRALNYIIERDGRTIFYGLDSSRPMPETVELLADFTFDLAVLDATFGPREIDPSQSGHQNFAMLEQTVASFRQSGVFTEATTIVGSHISLVHVPPHDEIVDELAGRGILLAHDGMIIDL